MEWLIAHGVELIPLPLRVPFYLTLGAVFLYIGWRTPADVAPVRRIAFFSLASACYFALASPTVVRGERHLWNNLDPAYVTLVAFVLASAILFLISGRRKEPRVAVRLWRVRIAGEKPG